MNSKTCVFSPKAASELGLDGADLILLENFIQKKDFLQSSVFRILYVTLQV